MKINKTLFMLGAAVGVQLSSGVMAATVNGNATALVITPLAITETTVMDFGTISGGPSADTIVMDTAGVRTVTGTDAQTIAAGPGSAGSFTITGEPSQAYSVSFSASATLDNGSGATMTVDSFTDNSPSPIDAGGTDTLLVGATLNVGANQAAGNYSTTSGSGAPYSVTVNYN